MSEPIQDGGAAFPTKHEALDPRATGWTMEPGMTLRDYFAGQAIVAIFSSPRTINAINKIDQDFAVSTALGAYDIADAMLAAREARP